MLEYWVWLQNALGYGNKNFTKMIKLAKSPYNFYYDGKMLDLLSAEQYDRSQKFTIEDAKKVVELCKKENIGIVPYGCPGYPYRLMQIPNPPIVLYYIGTLPSFDTYPAVCIVGPRKASDYAIKSSYALGGRLGRTGFIVVSGGALGCDTAAHLGALRNDGKTVAVLGNGFGADYLKTNRKLREEIEQFGCLISEFRPYTPVFKTNFRLRNRILSGLSNGVVVVEAGLKSGALITAGYAAEHGRDLFVVPGNPGKRGCEGSNRLIQDGAIPLIDLSDILTEYTCDYCDVLDFENTYAKPLYPFNKALEEYREQIKKADILELKQPKNENKCEISKKILPEGLSKYAKMVYNQLDKQIFGCDDLMEPHTDVQLLLAALGELEIYGFIKSLPGGKYSLI